MSKAEELAKKLNGTVGEMSASDWGQIAEAARHLRALDASHQRLLEALEAFIEYDDSDDADGINMMNLYAVALELSRAAIKQAKELS